MNAQLSGQEPPDFRAGVRRALRASLDRGAGSLHLGAPDGETSVAVAAMEIRFSAPVCEPGLPSRARRWLDRFFTTAWDPADAAGPAFHYNAARAERDLAREDLTVRAWAFPGADYEVARRARLLRARCELNPYAILEIAIERLDGWAERRTVQALEARLRRRYQGRFVDYLDLDTASRVLLSRARAAVSAIGSSAALQAGLLDDTAADVAWQGWQAARMLAGGATPAAREVVEALEDYAREAAAADAGLAAREARLRAQDGACDPGVAAAAEVAAAQIRDRAQSARFLATALEDPGPCPGVYGGYWNQDSGIAEPPAPCGQRKRHKGKCLP